MAQQTDKVFNDQAFLLDFFDQTVDANEVEYDNFIQLEGQSAGSLNRILARGNSNIIWGLTTAQLALLVPKIALYKVINNPKRTTEDKKKGRGKTTEKRFIFDDYTSVDSLTKELGRGRGEDASLISFAWEDQGTDPGNSGVSFLATLKLKFASFDGIFKDRGDGISFADLLVPPGVVKKKGVTRSEQRKAINKTINTPSGRRRIDPSEFQIKAVVGWNVPQDPGKRLFPNPHKGRMGKEGVVIEGPDAAAIRQTQVAFLLTLTGHEIDIKENGSIDLTINYQASIEGYMLTPKADLLKIDYAKIKPNTAAYSPAAPTLEAKQKQLRDFLKKTKKVGGKMTGNYEKLIQGIIAGKKGTWKDFQNWATKEEKRWMGPAQMSKTIGKDEAYVREVFDEAVKVRLENEYKGVKYEEEKEKVKKGKIEAAKKDIRAEAYARLLCAIDNQAESRLFYVELNQTQIELYKRMYEAQDQFKEGPLGDRNRRKHRQGYRKQIHEASPSGGLTVQRDTLSSKERTDRQELNKKLIEAAGDKGKRKAAMRWYKDRNKGTTQRVLDTLGRWLGHEGDDPVTEGPPYILNFFYFGDLVSAALSIINENPANKTRGVTPAIPTYKDFRFILGTIDLYDPQTDTIEAVPLADIPIASVLFQNWYRKNVIEKDLMRLPLLTFLRQICTQLIVGSLKSMRSYRPTEGPLNTKLSTSSFLINKFQLGTTRKLFKGGGRLRMDRMGGGSNEKRKKLLATEGLYFTDISNLRQYYYLYIGGTLNQHLRGNEDEDHKRGIFHAYVGKNEGAIKRVTFKRTDLPFQREARLAEAPGQARSNLLFSDWYNAEVTMVGNTVFRPGMLLFINPQAMGYGMGVAKKSSSIAESRAAQMGIGGYYLVIKAQNIIESGKYETVLTLIAQTPIYAINKVGWKGAASRKRKNKKRRAAAAAQKKKELAAEAKAAAAEEARLAEEAEIEAKKVEKDKKALGIRSDGTSYAERTGRKVLD